ncbi:pyridoxamine 5'-phosphate oxidase family protein [Pelagerythrobacter rhizovicinus]|uniref:Uncharacterized protein n=1 Tax=Pelagerythrobacter rhizovicinus TaxID=2268576 RepID=A0A4Q2KRN7_9SPHN|nr:pyridoxamine 5'-phosphate oxidase family protein [Pelagerythrobacter rhizovicinus]RXZ66343.1 hypothetical protein ETX26_06515 [Pelagerythrobacter rhizovicinus]
MSIDEELAAFMASPVMIILGSCDGQSKPEIGRAMGALAHAADNRIDLMVSAWQWPRMVANVRAGARLAATFARPSDYVSYQVKGHATVATATDDHAAAAAHYIERITATLGGLGLDRHLVAPWLVSRDLVVLCLSVEEIFIQTPGTKAGQRIERR